MVTTKQTRGTSLRRGREQEARRRAILAEARKLFIARGIAATTMSDIAAAAQLAKGTLYLYFASKDDLAFTLLLDATDSLLRSLHASIPGDARAVEKLERLTKTYYRFFADQPESFRYMFVVPHEGYSERADQALVERWAAMGREALGLVADLLRQGSSEGDLAIDDPWPAAVALWSAVTGVIVITSQEVRRPFIGEVDVERMTVDTLRVLLRGLRSTQANVEGNKVRDEQ